MPRTTASIVVYKSSPSTLEPLIRCVAGDKAIVAWAVVDNSAAEFPQASSELRDYVIAQGGVYLAAPGNIGFGAGHNLAVKTFANVPSEFHVMLNPDITFEPNSLSELEQAMDEHPDAGLMMPRICYPDGSRQYLCKLLPTPLDFALRRFSPSFLQGLLKKKMDQFDLREMDPAQPEEIPYLSGCFMFTRRSLYEELGGFNERYFLYIEDTDLCRRIAQKAKVMYWPNALATHEHQRGNHSSLKLTWVCLQSAFIYFGDWGWFFDKDRRRINRGVLERVRRSRAEGTHKYG